ncbi:hypothetical protein [Kitasatospora sp. MBT63]|uniref:hypothetical protein n=1 Tax=Kitasatospora sp. MBT63 TaxID=1444768 RepID=UPI000539A3E3|nr:hypothetical protein [Kitasatospora sp. MBT63]
MKPALGALVAAHSPAAGENPWSGTWCHDCSYALGTWTPWPCSPLEGGATVTAIEGGWDIRQKTTPAVPAPH